MPDQSNRAEVSHAGLTFTYLGWGRAFGTCSCGWPTQTVRFGRYDQIAREWDGHKAETRRCGCPSGCDYSIAADWAGTRQCPRCLGMIP